MSDAEGRLAVNIDSLSPAAVRAAAERDARGEISGSLDRVSVTPFDLNDLFACL
jgi:hypothetical protein